MTSLDTGTKRGGLPIGAAGAVLAAVALVIALFALPKAALAAEVTAPTAPLTSAQELVDFLNSDSSATPNAELNADGNVQLLAPVTVTGDALLLIDCVDEATIGLDLGGQTLTIANNPAETGPQINFGGDGVFKITGEGNLTCSVPADKDLIAVGVYGAQVEVSSTVTVERPESPNVSSPLIYIDEGSLNLHEGGTLREVIPATGESAVPLYEFLQCGYYDCRTPCSFTMDGGAVEIADNHWGMASYDGGTIVIGAGEIHHVSNELVGDEYPDAMSAYGDAAIIMSGGTVSGQTAVGAKGGGKVTVMGGTIDGVLYGSGGNTTVGLTGGTVTGYDYGEDSGSVSLSIENGAAGTMTGGLLEHDAVAAYEGSSLLIFGGSVEGSLLEYEGGQVTVVAAADTAPAVFSHPVAPSQLEGLSASLFVDNTDSGATMSYYPTLAEARAAATAAYANTEVFNCNCATVGPDAVVDFGGFSDSPAALNQILEAYSDFTGEDLQGESDFATLYAFATVTPGQAYTFTFSDENGVTVGEKTLTAGANDRSLFATVDVSTNETADQGSGVEPVLTAAREEELTIDPGIFTVTVKPASGGATSALSFGVSAVTYDFNGGAYEGVESITGLSSQGRWGLVTPTRPGYVLAAMTGEPEGLVSHNEEFDQWALTLPLFESVMVTVTAEWTPDVVEVSRLWNPYNGAHLLTRDPAEVEALSAAGWKDEGPVFGEYGSAYPGSTPVTRVYNPYNGDHLYSTNEIEVASLIAVGWQDEGVKFYGSPETTHPVYRLWNSYQTADGGLGAHLWTADHNEYITLPDLPPVGAWRQEGAVWYAASLPD